MSGTNGNNDILYLHITPCGKKYFGVTGQKPEKRWKNGKGYKPPKNEEPTHFWKAIQKYGWDNITHVILADDLTPDEADMFEKICIALYDTTDPSKGYNQDRGGRGKNQRHSEKTKQKMSEAQKGEKHHMYGKHPSEETKQKMSESHKGKHPLEESRQKMSESHKGLLAGEKNPFYGKFGKDHNSSKTVICITTRQVYYGAAEAGRATGINRGNISSVCNGDRKSAGKLPDGTKLKWKYVKDLPKPQVPEDIKQLLRNGPKPLKIVC